MQPTLFPAYSPKPRQDITDRPTPGPTSSGPTVHARNRTLPAQDGRPQYSPMRHPGLAQAAGSSTSTSTASGNAPLLNANGNEHPEGLPPLILAARNGDLRQLTALLAKPGMDINQVDYRYGMSAIMHAAQQNHVLLVSALLDRGAEVNRRHHLSEFTALIIASRLGHVQIVRLLLKQGGIKADSMDACGYSALMHAANRNRPDVLACLLEAGASVNLAGSMNETTALIIATEKGHVDIVRLLMKRPGIDPDKLDRYGWNALTIAAKSNRPDIVECLLEARAALNFPCTENAYTPLILASMEGHVEVVKLLLRQRGIEPDQTDASGDTALMVAARSGRLDILTCLLRAGAQANLAKARNGTTALMVACAEGHLELVKRLLGHKGIDLDKTDDRGRSALIWAAMRNVPAVAACLLAAGASASVVDGNGQSALAHAVRGGIPALVEVLVNYSREPAEREFSLRYLPGQAASFAAIADLCAAYRCPTPDLFEPDDRMSFFRRLTTFRRNGDHDMGALRWLYGKGIRMACALQVDAVLLPPHLLWQPQQSSSQQALILLLWNLSRLPNLGGNAKVPNLYRDAGLSAAAVIRLSVVAVMQLTDLARLAADTLASMGGEMVNGLADRCQTMTEPNGEIDVSALRTRMLADGYCAPYAETIAVSWEIASTASRHRRVSRSTGSSAALPALAPETQSSSSAAILFAHELRRQLGSRDCLARLQSALGGSGDEALHILFQIQGDWLRQYCGQMLSTPSSGAAVQGVMRTADATACPG